MKKEEQVLPNGVKLIDGILYFGKHQVRHHDDKPYKVYSPINMCTSFAIRYTTDKCTYPTLCTTLDIILPPMNVKDWRYEKGFIWLCGVDIIGGNSLPSTHYDSWSKVEYILTNLVPELRDSQWFICIDDDDYVWDNETDTVRRIRKIETVTYEWDD